MLRTVISRTTTFKASNWEEAAQVAKRARYFGYRVVHIVEPGRDPFIQLVCTRFKKSVRERLDD